ncbi:class I SAM-dependent methyltransferase [Micromonospora phytophila]|uniref:class I SAM-dependent methyltransferase n=1 Tax=Micromonospora phytophila TaxID=709888 RepID=UPI00202EE61F|nr:class I SAM-dependent methyltransferase [Micromonospora phytophila]MCM0676458.1 class I SAM-dependent methyltransferase [Micromonospora phytophila]
MLGMSGRALSFGAVAEAYERFRPGYPVELFDQVVTYAGQPVRTALEIGAGTGKATRLFAQRGVTVTATEPDGVMLTELRKHVPATVRTVQAAFEDLRPGESYGLLYAAAALHWTKPEGRWSRVAALLEPDGVFASFGGPVRLVDLAVEEAVHAARAPFLDSDEVPSPDGTPPGHDMQWPGNDVRPGSRCSGQSDQLVLPSVVGQAVVRVDFVELAVVIPDFHGSRITHDPQIRQRVSGAAGRPGRCRPEVASGPGPGRRGPLAGRLVPSRGRFGSATHLGTTHLVRPRQMSRRDHYAARTAAE